LSSKALIRRFAPDVISLSRLRERVAEGRVRALAAFALSALLALSCTTIAPRSAARQPADAIGTDLTVRNIAPAAWVVTHEKPWPANSLVYRTGGNHIVLVGTPYTPEATDAVLTWIRQTFGADKPITAINPHFHFDAAGGNAALLRAKIAVYGSDATVRLMLERGEAMKQQIARALASEPEAAAYFSSLSLVPPDRVFPLNEAQTLSLGGETVEIFFPGAAHAPDNIVVYFPAARILFGGCMVRADGKLGNLADADVRSWPAAVRNLQRYNARLVVPGHGINFSPSMLRETEAAALAAQE
jgi:metallo-beta-lactamase class B